MTKVDLISLDYSKCESIIESKLFHYFSKPDFFQTGIEVGNQFTFVTSIGEFRFDFIISCNVRLVGIECDGKQFHIPTRDFYRDSILLGEGHVDCIYRIRGKDIIYGDTDPLLLISHMEPEIFSSQAVKRFETELSNYIHDILESQNHERPGYKEYYLQKSNFIIKSKTFSMIHYPEQERIDYKGELDTFTNTCKVDKYFIAENKVWSNGNMENFYQFCRQYNESNLDRVIQNFHGYGFEPLCDEPQVKKTINDLHSVLPVYGEKADFDEWFSKLKHLSVGQLNDGLLEIVRTKKAMPSLIDFAEACYSARKNEE